MNTTILIVEDDDLLRPALGRWAIKRKLKPLEAASAEEALVLLDSLGLVVSEIAEVFRFGRDQGVVVEQEPASEIELERGAEVRLKVGMSGGVMEQ